MESNFESSLSMISRMIEIQQSPDNETIDHSNKITIIEIQSSDLVAVKAYLYYLIHRSLLLCEESVGEEFLNNDNCPAVMIFDGQFLFNDNEFIKHFTKAEILLKGIQIFRPVDECLMLIHLYKFLPIKMITNGNLRLIVIICNPNILFPELIDKINYHLFSLSISVRIILLVDHLNNNQINFYRQKAASQILKCKYDERTKDNQIKIMIYKNETTIIRKSITVQ